MKNNKGEEEYPVTIREIALLMTASFFIGLIAGVIIWVK